MKISLTIDGNYAKVHAVHDDGQEYGLVAPLSSKPMERRRTLDLLHASMRQHLIGHFDLYTPAERRALSCARN